MTPSGIPCHPERSEGSHALMCLRRKETITGDSSPTEEWLCGFLQAVSIF